jgi:hypothetical protein
VLDGPVYSLRRDDSTLVTYRGVTRDMSDRERKVDVFSTPNRVVSRDLPANVPPEPIDVDPTSLVWPRGPTDGWGFIHPGAPPFFGTIWLINPTTPAFSTVIPMSNTPGGGWVPEPFVPWDQLDDGLRDYGVPSEQLDANGVVTGLVWDQIAFQWRFPGETDAQWRTLDNMPVPDPAIQTEFQQQNNLFFGNNGPNPGASLRVTFNDRLNGVAPWNLTPPSGALIEWRVVPLVQPSESVPFYWDGNLGTFLRDIWDGRYSRRDPKIKYNAASVDALEARLIRVRVRISAPEDDMREWVSENLFQPFGLVPTINSDGEIEVLSTDPPGQGVVNPRLDTTNVGSSDWSQDGGQAITVVEVRYKRSYKKTFLTDDDIRDLIFSGALQMGVILERDVAITRISDLAGTLSPRPFVIEPETLRAVGEANTGNPLGNTLRNELASAAAFDLAHRIEARYKAGPQLYTALVRPFPAAVRDLKVGTWVDLSLPWLPDLDTGTRGGTVRMALIVRLQKVQNLMYQLTLLDGGPGALGLIPPLIG